MAEAGRAASGSAAAAADSDSDAEAPAPVIWESVERLRNDHPPLYIALNRVRDKISRCLSKSYAHVDPKGEEDHAAALLALTGTFRVETSTKEPYAYGFTDAQGIAIHADLVAASDYLHSRYVHQDDFVNTLDGLSYVAILEETIEHELGHLKNHQKPMNNPSCSQSTTGDSPLKNESGYAVQLAIRRRFFGQKDTDEGHPPRILQASDACHKRKMAPPVEARWVEVTNEGDKCGVKNIHPSRNLTMEELQAHMNYPPDAEDECGEEEEDRKLTPRELRLLRREKRKRGDDDQGGGSSKKPARRGGGSGGSTKKGSRSSASAKGQTCTDADGVDAHVALYGDEEEASIRSTCFCQLKIEFCDSNRTVKSQFEPKDNIYVLLTFHNPTSKEDVYAVIHRGLYLGRTRGVELDIEGTKGKYVRCAYGPSPDCCVKIGPSKSYTFFRLFCPSQESGIGDYRYYTPQEKGEYWCVLSCSQQKRGMKELGRAKFEVVEEKP